MTYFITQKLAYITANVTVRAEYTRQAQRATSENIYTLERVINTALPQACQQLEEFEDYVGEPMPPHLHAAMTTEISFWRRLAASLQDYRESEPNEHDAVTYAKNVRQFLSIHHDLLQLTQEIINSCLVEHYTKTIDALRHAASQVSL